MPTSRAWTVAGIGVALMAAGRILGSQGPEHLGLSDASDAEGALLLERIRAVTVLRGGSLARAWDSVGSKTASGARWGLKRALV